MKLWGATVDWNNKERKVTIQLDGRTIVLWIDKRETIVDGKTVYLDVPAMINNNFTFVPIRFVSENFGREVDYDSKTKKITIKANAENANHLQNLMGTWNLWIPLIPLVVTLMVQVEIRYKLKAMVRILGKWLTEQLLTENGKITVQESH